MQILKFLHDNDIHTRIESDGESETLKNKRERGTKKSGSKARDEYNEKFQCIFAI